MKKRSIRIWLSKGWYYAVYSVSLLLVPLFTSCSSSRSSARNSESKGEAVADNKTDSITVNFDYLDSNGDFNRMRIMYGVQPPMIPADAAPMLVLDGQIVTVDKEKLSEFDFANDSQSKEKVAALFGIKEKKIKQINVLKDLASTTIWGARGRYGVLEVKTK